MGKSWRLGRLAGIDVRIHWTFLLLPAWIYFSSLAAGSGMVAATVAVLFLLAIFGCVVLHELGHSLMARQFGIATRNITLLPIGGVASLERMPRNPWQELAIAIAGPAVNVVIAMGLFMALSVINLSSLPSSAISFLSNLALVNVVLVVFNMLPAFPMDGGRILRALLALTMPYAQATSVAARVGQFVAVGLGILGLVSANLMLILVAGFVYLAATSEATMADETFAGATTRVRPKTTLLDADGNEIAVIPSSPLPVVDARWNAHRVLGQLTNDSSDEVVVSDQGVPVVAIRKRDLRTAVESGYGSQPIERLLVQRVLPFRNVRTSVAA